MRRTIITFALGFATATAVMAPIASAAYGTIFLHRGESVRIERSDNSPPCTIRKLKTDKVNDSNGGLTVHCLAPKH